MHKVAELVAVETSAEEASATAAACETARAMAPHVPHIPVRAVKRKVRVLKRGAEPSASGWRNSFLTLIADRPDGAATLARWARVWFSRTTKPRYGRVPWLWPSTAVAARCGR